MSTIHHKTGRSPITLAVHAGMTPKQSRMLTFIKNYMEGSGGVAPSFQEITDGCGYKSKSRTHEVLRALRERGHIGFLDGRKRSIWLIEFVS